MHDRGFAICSYARSGTNLLCRAMEATGKLGSAQEFFYPRAMQAQRAPRYPVHPEGQIAKILTEGRTSNGVYGVKIFCDNFDRLHGYDWVGALPGLVFIHLERRDILRQAISCVRAQQTGQWHGGQNAYGSVHYDEEAIQHTLIRFARERARWQMFFARNDITPMWLVYEEMHVELPATIRRIAELVGVDDLPDALPSGPKFEVQRDELTESWREQFLLSNRDLTCLGQPDYSVARKIRRAAGLILHKIQR